MNFINMRIAFLKKATYSLNNHKRLHLVIVSIVLFFSSITIFEWMFDTRLLFTTNSSGSTTKFNTAFLFFLSTICLLICKKPQKKYKVLFIFFIFIILSISILTLAEYMFHVDLFVDNFFIKDTFSTNHPGRMSIATSACFTFFGIGLTSLITKNGTYKKLSQYIILLVSMISFINIITLILKIPTADKTVFFSSMSIQTSIAFALISFVLTFKFPSIGFTKMLFGNYFGSRSLRKLTPFIVIIPFALSFLLLTLINNEKVEPQFGILIYTILLIFSSFLYTLIIALGLNKSDRSRKRLEDDLVHKNAELSQFKEALDQIAIVAITKKNGTIKYVNDNFCTISEFSEEEIIGNTNVIVSSGFQPTSFYSNIWKTISSGKPWFGEIKNKSKSGKYYWTDTALIPLKNKNGYINEYMAIKLDISKRKEAEELLASKYVKTLEDKNTELEQFSYIASHDLQEPLRTITSFSDLLYEEYNDKLDDQAKQIFQFIKQSTGRMSSLIKNLLDYSRIGYQEELLSINCNELLQNISNDLNSLISESNSKLEINNLPTINAYPTGLRLLFQNLLTNAIKFSKKGVTPIIKINAVKKKKGWEFSINDNGIGIKKEFQNKVFAIFQRLHLKEEYEGTGIGLSHCQKIVNLHGGEIWVKSEQGKGSTFYFTISNLKK